MWLASWVRGYLPHESSTKPSLVIVAWGYPIHDPRTGIICVYRPASSTAVGQDLSSQCWIQSLATCMHRQYWYTCTVLMLVEIAIQNKELIISRTIQLWKLEHLSINAIACEYSIDTMPVYSMGHVPHAWTPRTKQPNKSFQRVQQRNYFYGNYYRCAIRSCPLLGMINSCERPYIWTQSRTVMQISLHLHSNIVHQPLNTLGL